jgi:hypothetical protein
MGYSKEVRFLLLNWYINEQVGLGDRRDGEWNHELAIIDPHTREARAGGGRLVARVQVDAVNVRGEATVVVTVNYEFSEQLGALARDIAHEAITGTFKRHFVTFVLITAATLFFSAYLMTTGTPGGLVQLLATVFAAMDGVLAMTGVSSVC